MRFSLIKQIIGSQKKILNDISTRNICILTPVNSIITKSLFSTIVNKRDVNYNTFNNRTIHTGIYNYAKHGRTRDDVMDDDDPEMARFLADLESDMSIHHNVILTDDDDISMTRSHSENEAINHERCQVHNVIFCIND